MKRLTVRQVLRLALPLTTYVAAGNDYLDNAVRWVQTMATRPPFFGEIHGGELLLISLSRAVREDGHFDLARTIAQLSGLGIAGIACVGEPNVVALASVETHGIPLLILPPATNINPVARAVQRLITRRSDQEAARAQELAQMLSEIGATCPDSEQFLALLTRLTGHAALLQDERGNLIVSPLTSSPSWPERAVRHWAEEGIAHLKTLGLRHPQSGEIAGTPAWAGWQAPVIVGENVVTALVLADRQIMLDGFSHMVAAQAALAWGRRLARERSAAVADANIRPGFVRLLESEAAETESALFRLAGLLEYDLQEEQWALVFAAANGSELAPVDWQKAEQIVLNRGAEAGWGMVTAFLHDRLILVGHASAAPDAATLRRVAEQTRLSFGQHSGEGLVCGIGRPRPGAAGLRASLLQAEEATDRARTFLTPSGGVVAYGDLALYRLLTALQDSPELHDFYRATLDPLVRYDRTHGTDLLSSLETYLQCHGNVSQAAKTLHIHRNTLIYRLGRVAEISALDLDEPETRLSLQLALRAARILKLA